MIRSLGVVVLGCLSVFAHSVDGEMAQFEPQTIDGDIRIGYGLAIGRVDSDEWPDVILADQSEIVWYENPGGQGREWPRHVMARNLTERDNVCVAARDIDGDGLVEVAVGGQWNPGETSDVVQSGAVFYLKRPRDPSASWTPYAITPHPATVHRMHWVRVDSQTDAAQFNLAVLPLHGPGNQAGQGAPVALHLYSIRLDENGGLAEHSHAPSSTQMHKTHNFEIVPSIDDKATASESLVVAGAEGLATMNGTRHRLTVPAGSGLDGAGEVRVASVSKPHADFVAIEPMHGNQVVLYRHNSKSGGFQRVVLDRGLNQGHALAAADLLGLGRDQIVAGWRNPDANGQVGIKLYAKDANDGWQVHVIDKNRMACEDLKVVDLDQDGKLDIVAAGRATNNLIIYWNK